MPFETRVTSSGGMVTGSEHVTREDGIAVLLVLAENPTWAHLIVDVSASDSPVVLTRDEELEGLHQLARIVRDLDLPAGFRIAVITSTVTAPRAADFVDLSASLDTGVEVRTFTDVSDALAWVDASLLDG